MLGMGVSWSSPIQRPRVICLLISQNEGTEGMGTQFDFPQSSDTSFLSHGVRIISPLTSAQVLMGKAESDSSWGPDSTELFPVGKCTLVL